MSHSTAARRCASQASQLKLEPLGDLYILPTDAPVLRAYRPGCARCPSLTGPLASPAQPARRMHRVAPPHGPPDAAARAAASRPA